MGHTRRRATLLGPTMLTRLTCRIRPHTFTVEQVLESMAAAWDEGHTAGLIDGPDAINPYDYDQEDH